jgi:hypothetical protein
LSRATANAAPAAIAGPESRLIGSNSTSAAMPISANLQHHKAVGGIGDHDRLLEQRRSETRVSVSWKVERAPNNGRNCFGRPSREAGHSRVPAPPHMIRGMIRLFIDFIP